MEFFYIEKFSSFKNFSYIFISKFQYFQFKKIYIFYGSKRCDGIHFAFHIPSPNISYSFRLSRFCLGSVVEF